MLKFLRITPKKTPKSELSVKNKTHLQSNSHVASSSSEVIT